ncbi:tyrosine-type recombinase/integrase [Burkholderia diffusa]|uniref:tyrosine-type recombinase/integrase n=1 Tax=Burkholderia diffusa TaxID=488732 RepID=UPI001FC8A3C7|nr:site-specific integrase [Burkholderia diffusa]
MGEKSHSELRLSEGELRHFNYTLTPIAIRNAKPRDRLYKLTDGGGLFLAVAPTGGKSWRYQYAFGNRRCEVTIGAYPEVGVAEAREQHGILRARVAKGENPARLKQVEKATRRARSGDGRDEFAAFSRQWIAEKLADKSDTYRKQAEYLLREHAWPDIGGLSLAEVKPAHVLTIIEGLRKAPRTAERVRVMIQRVFDYAIQKLIVESNPARPLRGVVTVPASVHFRHLNETELGQFWRALRLEQGAHPSTIAASKMLMYTMCRKSEVLKSKWVEFDLKKARWDIPAERMKMRKPHRVFLPRQAVDLLRIHRALTGDGEYVFPSVFHSRVPLTEATINHLFKRLDFGVPEFSPHGTRGTAATLLREHGYGRDVVELLLAHTERDQVAASYHHHELEPERRKALQFLADYVDQLATAAAETKSARRSRTQ